MRRLLLFAPLVAGLLTAGETRAQTPTICTILGPAAPFSVVATRKLLTRHATGYYNTAAFPQPTDDVCSAQLLAAAAHGRWESIAATRETGIAARFGVLVGRRRCEDECISQPCDGYYPCNTHEVYGDIATGGGRVSAFNNLLPDIGGVIDTTGTHPLVDECRASFAHLPPASAALAQGLLPGEPPTAARPITDLGDVTVPRDEEYVLTATGPGVTVYRIRNLVLEHGKSYRNPYYSYVGPGGTLVFDAGPGEFIVVNVTGKLSIGRHGIVEGETDTGVLNIVGSGATVRMHKFAESNIPMIALDRRIQMLARGGGSEVYYGQAAALFGRDVTLVGAATIGYIYPQFDYLCE